MEHPADEQRPQLGASQAGQVRPVHVKGVRHAQGLQSVVQLHPVFALEFGDGGVDQGLLRARQHPVEPLPRQGVQVVLQGRALVRQQGGESPAPALVEFQEALGPLVLQIMPLGGIHQRYRLLRAVLRGENLVLPNMDILIDFLPLRLQGQGVDQDHHGLVSELA